MREMPSPRSVAALLLLLLAGLVLAACDTAASSATPVAKPSPSVRPSAQPSRTGSVPPAGGQTETDWGTIWDTLPKGFPTPPGSTPAEETATGPASANLVVDGSDAKGIATAVQQALGVAGYKTRGLQGPLEDGSYVLDMTGSTTDCMVRLTAAPTGGLTTVTILYGAACPHD
jgi:hypothetical protein